MTTGDELLAALVLLRDVARRARAPGADRDGAAWRAVETFVRRSRATRGDEGDDVVQETLLAIARHVDSLDARDTAGAIGWCTRIAHHKRIDLARARVRRRADGHDGEAAVDLLERDDGRPLDDRALDALVEVVETAIAEHVDGLGISSAAERQLKRAQARATLHRILGAETDQIRAVLALEPTFGSDRLAKWVERGRPILTNVLEKMAWDHEGDAREVAFGLRDLVLARRADAGVARPARRRTKGEEDG